MRVVAGPGAYEAKQTLQPKGGLMVTRDKRFKYNADDLPGPGAYEVRCCTPLFGVGGGGLSQTPEMTGASRKAHCCSWALSQ